MCSVAPSRGCNHLLEIVGVLLLGGINKNLSAHTFGENFLMSEPF